MPAIAGILFETNHCDKVWLWFQWLGSSQISPTMRPAAQIWCDSKYLHWEEIDVTKILHKTLYEADKLHWEHKESARFRSKKYSKIWVFVIRYLQWASKKGRTLPGHSDWWIIRES